jgi:hypothetical protein
MFGSNLSSLKGLLSDEELAGIEQNAGLERALALMAASGPSTSPTSFASVLQQGLQQGRQAEQLGLQGALQNRELRKKAEQEQGRKRIAGMIQGGAQQALAGGGGPTMANAAKMQQAPDKNRFAMAINSAIEMGDIEFAKQLKEQMDMLFPPAKYEKLGEGEQLIDPVSGKVVASGAPKASRFSGAYGNLALAMFGTNNSAEMSPEQLQALDAEARRRQLERPPSVSVTVGGGENAFAKKGAELMAADFSDISVQGRQANRSLGQIAQLESLAGKTGGGLSAAAKGLAGNLGVDIAGMDDIQAFQALVSQLVPQQRPPGSGTMSDADLALFKQSLPRLINQPGGNQKIIRTMKAIAQYDVQLGKLASDALTGRISREEADRKMMELPNPLAEFSSGGGQQNDPLGLRGR